MANGKRKDCREALLFLPEPERQTRLLVELACALYHQEILSFGKAAELSQLSQFRFGQELAGRGITRHYWEEDIAEDLTYAGGQKHLSAFRPFHHRPALRNCGLECRPPAD